MMKMTRSDLALRLYRTNFAAFNRFAFRELHPGQQLHDNWHISLMADRLERCARGEIKRLIINIPPRSLKSHTASVAFPAWVLGRDPTRKIMTIASTRSLVADLGESTDRLLRSGRLRAVFPHLRPGPKPGALDLPEGGRRMPVLAQASQIGRGADIIIIDDPTPPAIAKDDAARQEANQWFDEEVIQRLNDKATGVVILVMQRLHPDDLTGHLLAGSGDWEHLSLPAIALQDERWTLSNGRVFERLKGEALAPETESRDQLRERLQQGGAGIFTGQYLQDPRVYESANECRGGAFFVDSGRGYPNLVFIDVPEANYLQREIFGDDNVFTPERQRPLTPAEREAFEKDQMNAIREMEAWFQREFIDNPSPDGPRTLPPGVLPAEALNNKNDA
jgi:hypothetical protein